MRDTKHFLDMLQERNIRPEWVDLAIDKPDWIDDQPDGSRHYLKRIPEHGSRWLRVVTNPGETPPVRVTAFFDRRLRRQEP